VPFEENGAEMIPWSDECPDKPSRHLPQVGSVPRTNREGRRGARYGANVYATPSLMNTAAHLAAARPRKVASFCRFDVEIGFP